MTNLLNSSELSVLTAVREGIILDTGNQFCYFDDIDFKGLGLSDAQGKGYLSQLVQKDLIHIDYDDCIGQIHLNLLCKKYIGGIKNFEFMDDTFWNYK